MCVCVCVCVREFTFENVVGAQLFSFMGEKDLVDFQVSAHRYIHKGFFTRGFFFSKSGYALQGCFRGIYFCSRKVVFSG